MKKHVKKHKKFIFGAIAVLLLIFIIDLIGQHSYRQGVIAVVEGEQINRQEFEDEVLETCGPAALEEMIKEELINQAIRKEEITVTEKEIDQEISRSIQEVGDEEKYWDNIEKKGISKDELRERIRLSLAMDKLLLPTIDDPTEDELKEYYEASKDLPEFQNPEVTYEDVKGILRERLILNRLEAKKVTWPEELMEKKKVENYFYNPPGYKPFGYFRRILFE